MTGPVHWYYGYERSCGGDGGAVMRRKMPTVRRTNRRRFLSRPGDRQQVAFPRHDVSPRPASSPTHGRSSATAVRLRARFCPLPTECPGQRPGTIQRADSLAAESYRVVVGGGGGASGVGRRELQAAAPSAGGGRPPTDEWRLQTDRFTRSFIISLADRYRAYFTKLEQRTLPRKLTGRGPTSQRVAAVWRHIGRHRLRPN